MPHFFIESEKVIHNRVTVSKDEENFHHIIHTRRTKEGEKILFIDEKGVQYEGVMSCIEKRYFVADILCSYPSKRYLKFDLSLAQSPLNSNSQSTIIEKATELGVNHIYPVLTDNCSVKQAFIINKIDKWQKIMYEASKQCERAFVPKCHELSYLENVVNMDFDRIIAFVEKNAKQNLKPYLNDYPVQDGEKVLIIIGPEGGFSKKEFEMFEDNPKIEMLSLGNLILKADTAVITAIGNIVL